jgi:hypothetical protein
MSKLSNSERLDLKKLIRESDAQDNTEYIRKVKHSMKIRDDVSVLDKLMKKGVTDEERLKEAAPFLNENYTDIFKKMIKGEIDLEIMGRLLLILKLIEDERVDQHEGSVMVGKILKELYVDSALKNCKKRDEEQALKEQEEEVKYKEEKPISWAEWRTKRQQIVDQLEKIKESIKEKENSKEKTA